MIIIKIDNQYDDLNYLPKTVLKKNKKNRTKIWLCDFFCVPLHPVIRNIYSNGKESIKFPRLGEQAQKAGNGNPKIRKQVLYL